jgi:hypothetical protein
MRAFQAERQKANQIGRGVVSTPPRPAIDLLTVWALARVREAPKRSVEFLSTTMAAEIRADNQPDEHITK